MYLLEEEWEQAVSSYKYIRSLDRFADTASLIVSRGTQPIMAVSELVPLSEFQLLPFKVQYSPEDIKLLGVSLVLSRYDSTSGNLRHSSSFRIVWRSKHFLKGRNLLSFTVRPHAIFVLVPVDSPVHNDGSSSPSKKAKKLPLPTAEKDLRKTIQAIADTNFSRRRSRGTTANRTPQGIGNPKDPYSPPKQDIYRDVFDATFTDLSPPVFSGQRQIPVVNVVKVSVNTPNFKRIKKSKLPVNPFAYFILHTYDGPAYNLDINNINSSRQYFGSTSFTYFTPPNLASYDSGLYNATLKKLIDKSDANISANLAQDIAQFGQLNSLIGGNARKIAKALERLRAKDLRGAARWLSSDSRVQSRILRKTSVHKSLTNNFLEMQYGWKILLKEIEELAKMIANRILDNPPVRRVTARSNNRSTRIEYQGPFIATRPLSPLEISEEHFCKIVLRYSLTNQQIAYVQQLGFLNPINLAYEILPGSFVADWLIPIGPALETLSSFAGMTFIGGSVTQGARQWVNATFSDSRTTSGGGTESKGGSYRRVQFSVERSLLDNFPRTNLPQPKNPFSPTHTLNAIALVVANVSKK